MLKIVRTGFSSYGKEEAKKEIRRLIDSGKHALMIVPEQQTVLSEIELASVLPSSAPLLFEVTNFTRLANTTFRALGGINGEYCDKGKKLLIMWRVLTELSPNLGMTRGKREINIGIVETALRAIEEMQSLAIPADILAETLANDTVKADKRLFSKLSDLSRIYSLYKTLLNERYNDAGDDCDAMIEKLSQNPAFLSGYGIYVDGFTSFTEPQYKLLGMLADRAELTVILASSKYTEDFFEETELRSTKERLISVARKNSAEIKLVDKSRTDLESPESISLIIDRIWRKSINFEKISLQNKDEIRVFEAQTPFDECSFVASDIKRRVMSGCSYRDFAIISRSEAGYSGILDGALKLAGIPYFSGAVRDAEAYELIKLIYSAYSTVRSGFVKEDVLTYAKCGLTGISREECDLFESYVETWQITGSRFTDDVVWNMNPKGYNAKRSSADSRLLTRINDTRKRLLAPLVNLGVRTGEAKTVREQAQVLLDFLLALKAEEGLKERAEGLARLGESALAEENLGLWKLVCSSLDTLIEVMGDSECATDGFVDQLRILFSGANMGKIPAHYDEVTVGCADILRLSKKKHIYLIGVNDGVFPATPSDTSYFSDKDKGTLSELGLNIRPELETKGARELYIFSRALSYATKSVTLLYSATSARFKAIEPSEVIKKIEELTAGAVIPIRISELTAEDRLYVAECALEEYGGEEEATVKEALSESSYDDLLRIREGDIANTDMMLTDHYRERMREKDLSLSQSKIDSYVSCPLSYFCKYTIFLSPEKQAEFDSSGVGTLVHSILENFFKALSEKGMSARDITADERIDLTRRAAEKYISEMGEDLSGNSTRTRIKIDRLCRAALPVVEGLCEEFSVSEFTPKFFELSISADSPDTPDPIRIGTPDGRGIIIGGIIDRVDTLERNGNVYVRVVDYKTGKKDFTPDDLKEGKNLQMFLYLRSIVESKNEDFRKALGAKDGGEVIPAGALYLKTFVGDKNISTPDDEIAIDTVKGEQKRIGMLLDDEDIIRAMGIKYTPLYREKAKDPNAIPDTKRNLLFSKEGFGDLMKTVEDSVIRVAESMRDGNINAEPRIEKGMSACDYCDYKAICRRPQVVKKF